jgi:hypothetical protein
VTPVTGSIRNASDSARMRVFRCLAGAFCLTAALCLVASVPSGMAPLPGQYVKGHTFHSPDGWFTIEVPEGWEWFEMRHFDGKADPRWPDAVNSPVAWMVREPKTFDDMTVMESYKPNGAVITEDYMRPWEEQMRKSTAADGTMTAFRIEPINIPAPQSAHYAYTLVKKNGKTIYRHGYMTGMEHKVFLSTTTDTPPEPKWFARAVVSLRWLKEP